MNAVLKALYIFRYSKIRKNVGIQVTVEDYSEAKIPYSSYEDIDWLLDNIPELKFTYDSGNLPLVGIDELEVVCLICIFTTLIL